MAWDSAYTAQLNSGYQNMAMGNLAYSQQIGMGGLSGIPNLGAQQIMGGAMNRMQGFGGPMMSAGLGLAGLDPLSLGLKAGMGAWGAGGGLMGAGLAGMGVAGAAAGGLAVGAWGANQMFAGAQQQQQLNSGLRSGFNFMNPMTGGQGFAGSQMAQIGGMLRHMTHQPGPGGEVVGMSELTSLASNMGRMGMANQVRDVQDFGRKFREMVSTLKSVATEMGTSLQEAQQFVSSMRGSGIFRTSDQLKYSGMAKGMAFSGGLALSEVTAMGNIGAQISRSVGGLGRSGTFAGMRTIGQIGTAQQMGILSEEDVYNTTGMYGAEGRQAMATNALQQSARFLQGGKGRRMLASLAGADGSLNEGAVQELLGGGMTISETMRNSSQNLGKIGRANFLRNEGRLRGSAMERLGGFLPGMQLKEWMQGKGMDINDMDDRSMLFAQRQLGMGRDEMDSAMKMVQNMPQILNQMRQSGQDQAYMDRIAQSRKSHGIEGVQNRFNQARERVQGSLQKIGQDFFNEGSEMVERWMNKLAGTYEVRFSKEAEQAYRGAALGSGAARSQLSNLTRGPQFAGGKSGVLGGDMTSNNFFSGYDSSDKRGMGSTGNSTIDSMLGVFSGKALYDAGGWLAGGSSMASQFKSAGYDMGGVGAISDPTQRDAALRSRLAEIRQLGRAANQPPSSEYIALGTSNSKWLQRTFANTSVGGEARMDAFEKDLQKYGSVEMKKAWESADKSERVRIMTGARAGAFGQGDLAEQRNQARAEAAMFKPPGQADFFFGGGATEGEKQDRIMKALGYSGSKSMGASILQGAKYGAAGGAAFAGIGAVPGAIFGALVGAGRYALSGNKGEEYGSMASFFRSDEATSIMGGLMSSDQKTRNAMTTKVNKDIAALRDKSSGVFGSLSTDEKGKMGALNRMLAASAYNAAYLAGGGKVDPAKMKELSEQYGLTEDEIIGSHAVLSAAEGQKASERTIALAHRLGSDAAVQQSRLQSLGVATFKDGVIRLDKDYAKALGADKKGAQNDYLMGQMRAVELESRMLGVTDPEEARALQDQANAERTKAVSALQGLSVAEKRKMARAASDNLDFETAAEVQNAATRQDAYGKAINKKGVYGATAEALGITLSKEEQSALKKAGSGSKAKDAAVRLLAERLGVTGDAKAIEDIQNAVSEAQKGGKGVAKGADILAGLGGLESVKKAREEKEKQRNELQADPGSKLVVDAIKAQTAALTSAISSISTGGDPEAGGGSGVPGAGAAPGSTGGRPH